LYTCIKTVSAAIYHYIIYDFDEIGVPSDADTKWRQQATESWIQRYLNENDSYPDICLCGQMVLGKILACPSAKALGQIKLGFLDCADITRINRLNAQRPQEATQDILNWATWLRMHYHNPQ